MLYVHGKGGSHLEAEQYRQNCGGFDLVGVAYSGSLPWVVAPQIQGEYSRLAREYAHISLLANSIGAYFAMCALQNCALCQALLISPVLDMERLILDMMQWACVTEEELCAKGEIPTDFGEILSWEYLEFVRKNPVVWEVPTEILYAGKDHLTSRATAEGFVATHNARLTLLEDGEHWFHTEPQMACLNRWMKRVLR